jgi:aryl-alcohol dehydrogenase-like predicted oxidoreductase
LQLHRYDGLTDPEETMRALNDLVQNGKVRYLGASSMWLTQFATLQTVAERNGWSRFVSMQNYYNLCYREEEREMIRWCKQTGVGIIPWSPLYAGKLARPVGIKDSIRSQLDLSALEAMPNDADNVIIGRVEELAKKKGWTMAQVALVWHRMKGTVPIVGMNSVKRVEETVGLRGKELSAGEIQYLEEPYVPKPVFGHL